VKSAFVLPLVRKAGKVVRQHFNDMLSRRYRRVADMFEGKSE
jgi:hypothetical protein